VVSDWENNMVGLGLGELPATWWQYYGSSDYDDDIAE